MNNSKVYFMLVKLKHHVKLQDKKYHKSFLEFVIVIN